LPILPSCHIDRKLCMKADMLIPFHLNMIMERILSFHSIVFPPIDYEISIQIELVISND
jgi:hypothetical protein